jgi:hypothetical protein
MISNKLILCLVIPATCLLGFLFGRMSTDHSDSNFLNDKKPLSASHIAKLSPKNNLYDLCLSLAQQEKNNSANPADALHDDDTKALIGRYAHTVLSLSTTEDIENQLKNLISDKQLALINDKKVFSARLIDEYLSPASTKEPTAEVKVFVSDSDNLQASPPQNFFNIPRESSLFMHLQATPSLLGGNVFVKISDKQTNKVLLYTAKPISIQQNNWVSFQPAGGWNNSNYNVIIYRLTDNLQAVGSANFGVIPQDN